MAIEPTASIDEAIQGALGRKLRESYDQVVREQVPDKFMLLLDQLKKSESDSASTSAGDKKADNGST